MNAASRQIMLVAVGLAVGLVAGGNGSAADAAAANSAQGSPGKQVFDRWCTPCHADSIRAPGTVALATKYGKDMPAALEQRTDLTPEVVQMFVRNGVTIMPRFRKTEISDPELAELGRYLSRSPARRR